VRFEAEIEELNHRVEEQAGERPGARLLMTHPGVGPVTALATDVFLGDPARFADGKFLASYWELSRVNTPLEGGRSWAG
jgi:transposase